MLIPSPQLWMPVSCGGKWTVCSFEYTQLMVSWWMVWKWPWWLCGCGYTDFISGAGYNLIIILCPSDDRCRFSQSTTPQLNTIPHSGQHTALFSNHSRCFKILSHYYTSIWNKWWWEWGQHFKILTLKDSPTIAHCRGILNLKYPNALTQHGAERAMLRIQHHAT